MINGNVVEDEINQILKGGELLQVKRVNNTSIMIMIDGITFAIDKKNRYYMVQLEEEGWLGSVEGGL
jgi:hypothetical protein